ncbi:DEAD/DEAH box helicase [Streptomyces sp. NBC_00648]|uniref:DEAD/DEAH box helicase n=1 Tax=Streptomyces sp. NBC_00648 TaxID=2975797 RepID=UPI003246CF1D
MPLDLSRLGKGDRAPLIRPRDIFNGLPNRPFPYLRQEQGEVFESWFDIRDNHDIVIKQNTGGGKTVVGLLIAQSTLNEGIGKAAYLTPDNYLASQARAEAHRLGLATASDPDDMEFRAERAILITTFHTLINGLSRFGVIGGSHPPMDLGIVIVDDAHAALAAAEAQFTLNIARGHAAYQPLLDMFEGDLRRQSAKAWADISTAEYTAAIRVPFWAWADRAQDVMELLHPYRESNDKFRFAWPLIADVLPLCAATATSQGFEIRPPCPPIHMIPSFAKARRRVYLTATLADDSVLVTSLDADPELLVKPVTPGSAADLGDRLILSPLALNRNLDAGAIRQLARQFANGDRNGDSAPEAQPINVVVIVPSGPAAEPWKPFADAVLRVNDLAAGVEALKSTRGRLVVLINKYDGVDLPGDACRLLIIDGVPTPMSGADRREADALAGSPTVTAREIQRIEQGMGRGVRDRDDHCAVLLLGANLARATTEPHRLSMFSNATQAQLGLSQELALQIKGEGINSIREALSIFLSRDPAWVEESRRRTATVRYAEYTRIRPEAVATRQAFDLAVVGQTSKAAERFVQVINQTHDTALRGWLMEQRAAYVHFTDSHQAQQVLVNATGLNHAVLRPAAGIAPAKAKAGAVQAREAVAFLTATYDNPTQLVLGVKAMLEDVAWDEERTNQAEAAWQQLGRHLGFASSRPDKESGGEGPDNLWILSSTRHAVTELKTGCTTETISKHDLNQLGGSVRWDRREYPEASPLPVMLHPSNICDSLGTPEPGMVVITPDRLDALKAAVTKYTVALADGLGLWHDEATVATHLMTNFLNGDQLFNTYATPARKV